MALFNKQIDSNIRDVDNTNSGGSWSVSSTSALNIGNPGAVTRNISLRFTGVTIPQGTTINSAKIRFIASATKTPSIAAKIEGVAEDNTGEFVTSPEDTARTRTKTSANAAWNGSISHTLDSALDTPDITSIVQEIVNRGGWASGNAMAFFLSDDGSSSGNYISVYEYNTTTPNGAKAAELIIDYGSGTTTSTSTTTTTTSTSTTVTTTTLPPLSPEYYGVKVYKQDTIESSLSPKDFFLNSKYRILPIHRQGSFKGTYIRNSGLEITIPFPTLPYRPLALVYMQRMGHDGVLDTDYHLLEWSYWGATKVGFQLCKIYKDKLYIQYVDNLVDDLAVNFSVAGYYYVFREEDPKQ